MSKVIIYNETDKKTYELIEVIKKTLQDADSEKFRASKEWVVRYNLFSISSLIKRNKSGISITFWEEENEN